MKVSNQKCRELVRNKESFHGSNLFGEWIKDKYVVFSYGYHFPLFVFHNGIWYENKDRYSVTTSKHKKQTNPLCVLIESNTEFLKNLINS